ncbi:MAG: hypothetical protein ABL984_00425 [Pyrinomonadaceae bacterium]
MISVRFVWKDGSVFDQRTLSLVPRMGEGVIIDGFRGFVGAVSHVLEGDSQEVVVTILETEEAKRFLGGT